MTGMVFRPVPCAICFAEPESEQLYPATVAAEDLTADTFSARRRPDRVHYRIVRCRACGLVRSDPVADPELVASLYRSSSFDYQPEVPNLVRTYRRYLKKVGKQRSASPALLEVGCGNGFMLEEGKRLGYASVTGIEPSAEAIERAEPGVRPFIICDILRPGLLKPDGFDVACLFQVFDHLPDPGEALDLCRDALKPGGYLLLLNHNVKALSARALGERSPIIDVEHTYLYDPRTLTQLCASRGLRVEKTGPAWNWCSVIYLAQLLPLPERLKERAVGALGRSRLGGVSLLLPLGNLYLIARKPPADHV